MNGNQARCGSRSSPLSRPEVPQAFPLNAPYAQSDGLSCNGIRHFSLGALRTKHIFISPTSTWTRSHYISFHCEDSSQHSAQLHSYATKSVPPIFVCCLFGIYSPAMSSQALVYGSWRQSIKWHAPGPVDRTSQKTMKIQSLFTFIYV